MTGTSALQYTGKMSNDEVIRDGLLQAKREVESYLLTKMQGTPMRFPDMALVNKPYAGFTGNAQTSYAVALYENGVMLMRHSTGDNTRKPIRLKIGYGKRVHLKNPFEGAERTVTGKTQLYTKDGRGSRKSDIRDAAHYELHAYVALRRRCRIRPVHRKPDREDETARGQSAWKHS
jgi:hypothetical protein